MAIIVFVCSALAVAEYATRALGVLDFPLYDANSAIGYIPKANQSGSFLGSRSWLYNSQHMGTGPFAPGPHRDILLVGDSLVNGGNPFLQEERLSSLLQQLLPGRVWPISAGSWSLRNEMLYITQHSEVIRHVDEIVFVVNSADFADASSWRCEETHPRSRPRVALLFVLKKYVIKSACEAPPADLKVPPGDWFAELKLLLDSDALRGKRVAFFVHSTVEELDPSSSPGIELEALGRTLQRAGAREVHQIARDPRWNRSLYRDTIHPTTEGNRVLAGILGDNLRSP